MKPLRAAVIGCGKIGSQFADDPNRSRIGVYSHAEAYVCCEQTELVAVCDVDPKLAEATAARWGIKAWFTTIEELLREAKPELVSICTPDPTHFALGMSAATSASVRGLFMEKPLAMSLSDADTLLETCRQNHVTLAVNYSRRYAQSHRRVKERIASGGIGRLQTVHGFYTKGILHNGTHWIDLLGFLCGPIFRAIPLSIGAEKDPDPTIDVCFELPDGIRAVLQGVDHRAFTIFEMDVLGTNGRIRITEGGHEIHFSEPKPSPLYTGYVTLAATHEPFEPVLDTTFNAVCDLARCVIERKQPICNGESARTALALALEALARQ